MAIAVTNLTNDASTTDDIGFTTASVTVATGKSYLLSFAVLNSASTQPTVIGTSGPGSAYSLLTFINFDTVPATLGTLFIYAITANPSSDQTSPITITFGQTNHAFAWSLDEITGANLSTPFPQYVSREDNTTPETTGTLGTMVDSNSRSFVALAKNTNTASVYTMDTNWTLLAEANVGSPTLHLTTCWSDADGAATSASFTQTTGSQTAGNIIVEIAAATATNVTVTAPAGQFSFTAPVPLISVTGGDINISPNPGAYSFAGTAPSLDTTADVEIVVDNSLGPWDIDGPYTLDDPDLGVDYIVRENDSMWSFSVPAPTIQGTIVTQPGDGEPPNVGPSLRRRFLFGVYKSVGVEKSLKDR